MADFSLPVLSSAYSDFLSYLKDRDVDAITLCVTDPTNIPTSAIKYNRTSDKFQEWSGAAWVDKVISLVGGGTGAATPSAARTNLGLGSIATQDNNAVNITGGTIGTSVNIDGSRLTSGLIPDARLGSGSSGTGQLFLADDRTWKTGVPVGGGSLWFTNTPPTGYLICDGSAINRTTYSTLFALIGTTFGAGDGSTTFNLPDLRQRFPLGKAASGTGSTLGSTGGSIDHTHSVPGLSVPALSVPSLSVPSLSVPALAITRTLRDIQAGSGQSVVDSVNPLTGTGVTGTGATGTGSTGTGTTGTGTSGANNPPYLVVNFIVKY